MSFLKDIKIFKYEGRKDLRESLSALEQKTEYNDRARKVFKKKRAK